MTRLHVLLIGVDCYMPNTVSGGLEFGNLSGCVRDINMVEAYLNSLTQKPDRLVKLTASGQGAQPAEGEDSPWPTYKNIVRAFQDITAQASEGDILYLHYSGHGVRTTTAYTDIKGAGRLDEGLVPTDYGQPGGNYVRDIQIAYLIDEMLQKKLRVTLVLDSCHSGGATRGRGSAVPRGVPGIDQAPRPLDDLVATPEQLAAFWQTLTKGGARAATSASGWLVEPKGYTLLAACRANELAYEDLFDVAANVYNGALTYWLLDGLRTLGTGISYQRLHDRLLGKIRGWKEAQTPQLQGEGDWVIFGNERAQSHAAIPVLQYDHAQQTVTLLAGEVHGLAVGAQLAIYPSADSDFTAQDQRLAVVEVIALKDESESLARITEAGATPIEAGHQAVLLGSPNLRLQRTVRMAQTDLPGRAELEQAIEQLGAGFVRLAEEGEKVDFQVAINPTGDAYELWDSGGDELPNLRPAISVGADGAAAQLARRLLHLAKFRNVQLLDNATSPIAGKVRLELVDVPIDPERNMPVVVSDQTVTLRIHNDLAPNPLDENDASRIVNATVLALETDWRVSKLFPAGAAQSEIIQPGEHLDIRVQLYVPEGYEEQSDIYRVFATQRAANFEWLTMPPLDEPMRSRGATRSASSDPLDQLLAAVSEDQLTPATATRASRLVVAANQARPWTVAEVKVLIKKNGWTGWCSRSESASW